MMTQDEKDDWVAALRSGKYQQMRGDLAPIDNNTGEYDWNCGERCALGVLGPKYEAASRFVAAPWVDPDLEDIVIELNDSRCLTFDEIAAWIEAYAPVSDGK